MGKPRRECTPGSALPEVAKAWWSWVLLVSGRILIRITHLRKEWEKHLFIPAPLVEVAHRVLKHLQVPLAHVWDWVGTKARHSVHARGEVLFRWQRAEPLRSCPRGCGCLRGGRGDCGAGYQSVQHGLSVFSEEKKFRSKRTKIIHKGNNPTWRWYAFLDC